MRVTSRQIRQIIREEVSRLLNEQGANVARVRESDERDWWETTPEEEEQIRQAEEAAFMRSPLVSTMHRARIFLDPHEIKDLIKRAGTQNPEKVIALYRSDLERAGADSSSDDWWAAMDAEADARRAEETALMNSELVRDMHRQKIKLGSHEIKDLINRAGSRNPDKVIALYRSDLERARSPEPLRFSPAAAPAAPQYSNRVEKMVAYYTTNPRGRHSWKTGAREEYADMAAGGDAGGIRDEYYAEGPEGPAWSDSDFQDVIDAVDG